MLGSIDFQSEAGEIWRKKTYHTDSEQEEGNSKNQMTVVFPLLRLVEILPWSLRNREFIHADPLYLMPMATIAHGTSCKEGKVH